MSESEASKSASGEESEDEFHFEYNFNSVEPYENDPEASDDSSSSDDSYEDENRIPREELEKRYEGIVNVNSWYEAFLIDMNSEETSFASTSLCVFYYRCKCGNCRTESLVGAREYRCCKELSPVLAKLAFEGLEVKCIREHNEYDPLTHKAVLLNVGPLLRGKDGKKYKRRGKSQSSENE